MDNRDYKQELMRRSYHFSLSVIRLIGTFSRSDLALEVIAKQLLRSATSIGANIVEAQSASSKRDFTNFLNYALKSANETQYWLELLMDSGKVGKNLVSDLLQEALELAKLLGSSVLSLRREVGMRA